MRHVLQFEKDIAYATCIHMQYHFRLKRCHVCDVFPYADHFRLRRCHVCDVFPYANHFRLKRCHVCDVFSYADHFRLKRSRVCDVFLYAGPFQIEKIPHMRRVSIYIRISDYPCCCSPPIVLQLTRTLESPFVRDHGRSPSSSMMFGPVSSKCETSEVHP